MTDDATSRTDDATGSAAERPGEGLVQPEGVDAGSAHALDEDLDMSADVRSGGRPDAAPERFDHPPEELLGPPVQDRDGPGQTRSAD